MNDAPTRFAEDQTGAASLLPREEGNLRVAERAESAVELNAWATEEGLRGATARELFDGYCQHLSASGFVLMRAYVSTQTLHPQWSGYGYTWRRELNSVREQQFARGPVSQEWLGSPFHALIRRSRAGEKNPWLRRDSNSARSNGTFPLSQISMRPARQIMCVSHLSLERQRPVARDWGRLFLHDRPPRRLPPSGNPIVAFHASGVFARDESSHGLRHRTRAPPDLPWT